MNTIVIESHIPFIHGIFEPYANVKYLDPDRIDSDSVRDADALIIRTRTKCNAALLDGSRCRVIATATIGTDHIDLGYCAEHGITVANAPGCNAPAVAQYVLGSIAPASGKTIGIVGVGHVGRILADWARALGMKVLLNDPPRQEAEGPDGFVDLDTIARQADIITFHTPLTGTGQWPTRHLADKRFFDRLLRKPVIINAARGPVTDTQAVIDALESGKISSAIIDCWEGEPEISPRLLQLAHIATPHIAGYSIEGKQRATIATVNAVAKSLGIPVCMPSIPDGTAISGLDWEKITDSYNPAADTKRLKENPHGFEQQRNTYALRHEPGF